jgi:hypothetical protein
VIAELADDVIVAEQELEQPLTRLRLSGWPTRLVEQEVLLSHQESIHRARDRDRRAGTVLIQPDAPRRSAGFWLCKR